MLSHIRTLSNLLPLLRYSGLPNKGKSGKSRDPTKVLAFKQGSRLFYTIYPLVKSSSYLLKTLYRDCVIGRVDSLTTIFLVKWSKLLWRFLFVLVWNVQKKIFGQYKKNSRTFFHTDVYLKCVQKKKLSIFYKGDPPKKIDIFNKK